jgi:hypothetical protein
MVPHSIQDSYKWYLKMELDLYAALHYSSGKQLLRIGINVSIAASLIQFSAGVFAEVSFGELARGVFGLAACLGLISFFKPLLVGILRALVLVVRPRRTKAELAGRRQMRDTEILQSMINSSNGPSHAAELRAMSTRS